MARERSKQLGEQARKKLRQVHAGAYGGLVLAKEDLIHQKISRELGQAGKD